MQYFLRLMAFLLYWIGSRLQFIIKLCSGIKKEQIPEFNSEILGLSALKLVQKLKACEISSEEIVREYIKRIKAVNPILNAVVDDRFSEAVEEAKKADQVIVLTANRDELFEKYPLFGVPFSVKESCGVEGLSHVVGSHYRRGMKSTEDGAAIQLLREAGAIPLLVSANPELCVSWETLTFTNGRCSNPYNTQYTPGGSSGGEGSLNGAGATVFGIGSDFCGSIRIPAMFNGVYGHKPSGGLVSPKGHFPNTNQVGMEKVLQMGPMTRFVEDLPLLLDIIVGENSSKLIDSTDIDKMKIFYVDLSMRTTVLPVTSSIKKSIENACNHFSSRGNEVQKLEIKEMHNLLEIVAGKLMLFVPPSIHTNLANPEEKTTTMAEIGKHFKGKPMHTLSALYFQSLYDFRFALPIFRSDYYINIMDALETKLKETLGNDGVLFFPTFHRPAFLHNTSIIHSPGTVLTGIFNVLGLPSLHVPMGLDKNGLPVGFQIVAAPLADKNCFKVAVELEKVFGGWIPPSSS
ncbi:fatty-acid amide hydrolase 2-A-like [Episyrphus balteatus]|uniref:fatty-acid amide hydrolase 2-A-like n=1 Tax=Episyrphus balteatus TaxID=286459 RepID=UPI002484F013|nr:fatty-acid amide hydrolase 2-A-like [Episyrphus balteatus]